jgi:hypothetical protein
MIARIIKKAILPNIPSASGVEVSNGIIYIIGDDSKTLFMLSHELKILQQYDLFESAYAAEERIPKKEKPDFECLCLLNIHGFDYLLVNGSGSKKNRDTGHLVKLPSKYNKKFFDKDISFKALFDMLKSNRDIVADGKLNLEASAANDSFFIMLNRANKEGNNAALVFRKEEMDVFLVENPDMVPFPEVFVYQLPMLDDIPSGFSGACIFEQVLFFTASAEDTNDAVEDGAIKGSIIGWIGLNQTGMYKGATMPTLSGVKDYCHITDSKGAIFTGKVESIAVYEKEKDNTYIGLAVTDSDGGNSELLMVEIKL